MAASQPKGTAMTKVSINLKHLHRQTTRHGKVIYYYRVGKRPRIRLPDTPGTREFMSAYLAAAKTAEKPYIPANVKPKHTLAWLITEYRRTASWGELSVATRRQRDNIMKHVLADAGHLPYGAISRKHIMEGIDRRKDRPMAARHFLDTMRNIFIWACSMDYVPQDPTAGVKVKVPKTQGHKVWGPEQMNAYEAHWPVGTRQRLCYDILAYTGLRRGDACRIGPQHVRDGIATLLTEKGGFQTEVYLPICPELAESIAATPHCDTAFVTSVIGKPYTKESLGNNFREWCLAAGIDGYSAHGLRKSSATQAANSGATEHELMAMYGWSEARTAGVYTRKANRRRLALQGAEKVRNGNKSPSPSLT